MAFIYSFIHGLAVTKQCQEKADRDWAHNQHLIDKRFRKLAMGECVDNDDRTMHKKHTC